MTKHFAYDALGNLVGRDLDAAASGSADWNQLYTDPARAHAITEVLAPDGQVIQTFQYDADGNVTERGDQKFVFDSANRLVCVGDLTGDPCDEVEFRYDADGNRIFTDHNGAQNDVAKLGDLATIDSQNHSEVFVHAMGQRIGMRRQASISLRQAGGAPLALPVVGPLEPWKLEGAVWVLLGAGGLLLVVRLRVLEGMRQRPAYASLAWGIAIAVAVPPVPAGAGGSSNPPRYFFYVADHLGSSVARIAEHSTGIDKRIFEPFGQELSGTAGFDPYFAGQPWEESVGLYDFDARWYDAGVGRFLSVDPLVRLVPVPQSMNGYSY